MNIKCFLFGHKFLYHKTDNIIFCHHCGIQKNILCNHEWENIDVLKTTSLEKFLLGYTYQMQCKKCGETRFKTVTVSDRYGNILKKEWEK